MAEQYAVLSIAALSGGAKVNFRSTPLPFAGRIRRILFFANGNAAGASVFDVNLDGESIFAEEDRPTIPAGDGGVSVEGLSVPHAENARVSIDADALPLGGLSNVAVVVVSDDMQDDKPAPIEFFIRAMYLGALQREPSTLELSAALEDLTTACFGFGFIDAARALATTVFTLPEFTGLTLTNAEFVARLYAAYLNRDASEDPDGWDFWTDALDGGETRNNVRAAFAVSTEFTNRAPLFCRSQAPVADATSIQGLNPSAFVRNLLDTRADVVHVTAALANLASELAAVPLGKNWKLLRITADRACRVRAYTRAAYRAADLSREIGTDPEGEHGLIFDFFLEATNLAWDCEPRPDGTNLDDAASANAFVNVENLSGATHTVTVTFTVRQL